MTDSTKKITRRTKLAFATGEIGDNLAYQSFSFLVFTFYFTLVKLDVRWITGGFIIWSLWNSINDPLLGWLSDRTKNKKLGRRIPWMIIGTIPLSLVMILMFTPPLLSDDAVKFIYFLLMLFIFDFAYTSFNINYNAMFSEMFISMKERSKVGQLRIVFAIAGVAIGFVAPTFIITDLTNQYDYANTQNQFIINGIIAAIIICIMYFITIKWGARKSPEFANDAMKAPSFIDSLKYTLGNKAFLIYLIPALGTWIVIGILPAVIPLWAT
ncbi:MAG: MFS transporter, partial [Promethearchaeota archaeon]